MNCDLRIGIVLMTMVILMMWIHGYEEKLLWILLKVNSCDVFGALKIYG